MNADSWQTQPLAALLGGTRRCIEVVERPSAYTPKELLLALDELDGLLCPWPARRIKLEFWETRAGKMLRLAQRQAYQDDVIWPLSACRLLWGADSIAFARRLDRLVLEGHLKMYYMPFAEVRSRTSSRNHSAYLRHSKVLAYYLSLKENNEQNIPGSAKV